MIELRRFRVAAFVVVLLLAYATPRFARAQVGAVAREVVETAVERVVGAASRDAAEELTAMGGRTAVRELMEQASREGGDALVQRVAQYGAEQGPSALRVIGRSPAKMVQALDALAPAMREQALRAAARDPQAVAQLVTRYGSGALELAARHPGVGVRLAEQLGRDGIETAAKLTTDEGILLSRHAAEINALAPAQRASVLATISKAPAKALQFLEDHPKLLLTGAGVATFVALKDDLIGDRGAVVLGPDGKPTRLPASAGFLERLSLGVVDRLSKPINLIATALAGGVWFWLSIRLWGTWRRQRIRNAALAAGNK